MIDKDFLQGCTKEQINKGVAWLEIKKLFSFSNMSMGQQYACNKALTTPNKHCTNPNDAMPIAFANKIGLRFSVDNGWIARMNNHISYNENPLRALMEVYLLMSNEK